MTIALETGKKEMNEGASSLGFSRETYSRGSV
jgi:hypothetical protein